MGISPHFSGSRQRQAQAAAYRLKGLGYVPNVFFSVGTLHITSLQKVSHLSLTRLGIAWHTKITIEVLQEPGMKIKAIIWQEDGVWCGSVPALPGCHTWGESYEQLLMMLEDAVQGWLEAASQQEEVAPGIYRSAP